MIIAELIRALDVELLVLDNFLCGLSDPFAQYFKELLDAKKKGRTIVIFSNSFAVISKLADEVIQFPHERVF